MLWRFSTTFKIWRKLKNWEFSWFSRLILLQSNNVKKGQIHELLIWFFPVEEESGKDFRIISHLGEMWKQNIDQLERKEFDSETRRNSRPLERVCFESQSRNCWEEPLSLKKLLNHCESNSKTWIFKLTQSQVFEKF